MSVFNYKIWIHVQGVDAINVHSSNFQLNYPSA
jgi:hypothetical protein